MKKKYNLLSYLLFLVLSCSLGHAWALPAAFNVNVTNPADVTLCAGGTASFSVTASNTDCSGGTVTFTYQWLTNAGGGGFSAISGATNATLTITGVTAANAGKYKCTVNGTCSSGSTDSKTSNAADLNVNTPPVFTSCPSPVSRNANGSCIANGGYNGSIHTDGSPAPTFSYVLTGVTTGSGSGNGSTANFNLGTTNVTVTATNSCGTATCSFTVTVSDVTPPTITAPGPITAAANSTGCNWVGSLGTPVVADNCSGVTYSNDAPASFPVGTSTVTWTATDGSGNTATATQSVTITNPVTGTVTAGDVTVCVSGSSTNNSVTLPGSPSGGTWSVSNPYSNAASGTYSYTYTYTNTNGCSASASSNITVNAAPSVSSGNVSVCASGSSTNNSVTLPGSPSGGTWTVGNPYSNPTSGTYAYTYTYTNGNGCTSSATSNITVNAAPSVSAGDVNVCETASSTNTSVTLPGSPSGGSWSLSNPYSNPTAGTYAYTYSYTDGNGCTSSATSNITVNGAPIVSAGDVSVCASGSSTNNSVTLPGAPSGGTWSVDNPYSNATAGTYAYTYTYTDGNGCTSSSTSNITVNAAPSVSAGDVSVCASGSSTNNSVTLPGAPSGGTWSVGNPYSNPTAGTYAYTYSYTDDNGCTSSATSNITVNAAPSISTGDVSVCASGSSTNNSVTLPGTPSGGTWSVGNPYSNATAGTYSYTYTYTNGNGCTSSATSNITVNAAPSVSAGDVSVCASGSSTNNSVTLPGTPSGGTWTVSNPYSNATAGTYSYIYTYTDGNGCTSSATSNITVNAAPSVSAGDVSVCASGSSTNNSVTLPGSPSGGTWSVSNPYNNATAGTYNYTYTYTNGNGCTSSATSNIIVNTVPTATASITQGACHGNAATVTVTGSGGLTPYSGTGTFSLPDGSSSTYTISDAHGCSATSNSVTSTSPSLLLASVSPSLTCLTTGYGTTTVTITSSATGGTAPYTTPSSTVSPTTTSTSCIDNYYTLTVTDNHGCTATATADVKTRDVRCYTPSGVAKVNVCHHSGRGGTTHSTLCVDGSAVPDHLGHGDELGACNSLTCCSSGYAKSSRAVDLDEFRVYPNPTTGLLNVEIPYSDNEASVAIYDLTGRLIVSKTVAANTSIPVEFNLSNAPKGMYIIKVGIGEETLVTKIIVD